MTTSEEREPTEAMLIAARDWSAKKYGKPIGDDAAIGCWQAMFDARTAAREEPVAWHWYVHGEWRYQKNKPDEWKADPLYAAPPAAGVREALRELVLAIGRSGLVAHFDGDESLSDAYLAARAALAQQDADK